MSVNNFPEMTLKLATEGIFSNNCFTIVDVGAMGGVQWCWHALGSHVRVIGFEPNADEASKLSRDPRLSIVPSALGAKPETRKLFVHRNPSSSSLFPYSRTFADRLICRANNEVVAEQTVQLDAIDNALAHELDIDFIKLDAEGGELDIIRGGRNTFSRPGLLGVLTEVRFNGDISPTPLFGEVDAALRVNGFRLYDLDLFRAARRALPYPQAFDIRHDTDARMRIHGMPTRGQVGGGDALYLKDALAPGAAELSAIKLLKLACFCELFEQNDSAAEILIAHRQRIDAITDHRRLLDLLVPEVRGTKFSFVEYIRRYEAFDPIFRPKSPSARRFIGSVIRKIWPGFSGQRLRRRLRQMIRRI